MAIAADMKNLAEDIVASYDLRVAGIGEIKEGVKGLQLEAQELVKGFHSIHEEMAAKLREELSEDEKSRKSEVKGILREAQELVKDSSVARRKASGQLRKELGEYRQQIKTETSEILNNAYKIRNETKNDLKEATATWQEFATTMQQKRAGVKVAPKVEEAKVEVTEEAIAEVEPAAVTPEIVELQGRVFEYIADHPDGTRMVELEREFDIARIQMVRVIRGLIDNGKAEKRDLLYFAI